MDNQKWRFKKITSLNERVLGFIIGKTSHKGRDLKMLTVNDLVEKLELKVVTTNLPWTGQWLEGMPQIF